MSDVYPALAVNPFEDDAIREPRAVHYSVTGLNDEPLNRLVVKFERLTTGSLPRAPITADTAQLVVSPDAGYGKSHLLGRLFQRLGAQATLVYVRPFQDPERAWSSILLTTIQELERSSQYGQHSGTQLEAFATGVLAHVAADFMTKSGLRDNEAVKNEINYLRDHPFEILGASPSNTVLRDWLCARLDNANDLVRLGALLSQRGLQVDGREKAWLKILAGYAFSTDSSLARDAALTWLRGEPLEKDQVGALKLAAADNDGSDDATARQINDLSLRRLRGLCMLSSYYRPLVFCFDQTEFYGSDKNLTDALGDCMYWMRDTFPNQLTIVTTNATNWSQDLRPQMKPAYQARFSAPIDLEGINLHQAKDLLTERLKEFQLGGRVVADFIDPGWLASLFMLQQQIGVRRLLAQAAERFRSRLWPTSPRAPKKSIEEVFDIEVNKVRAKPALQQYSQDCLMWFAESLAGDFDGVKVVKPTRRYFSVQWEWPDHSTYFAFEAGHNNARWRAIAAEATRLSSNGGGAVNSIIFRTPDLKPVPGPNWKAARQSINDAREHGLQIVSLTIDEVCDLHAGREFYSNALQGNVDFQPSEVLRFLRGRFTPWFKKYSQPHQSSAPRKSTAETQTPRLTTPQSNGHQGALTTDQVNTVVSYLRENMLVDIKEVLAKLGAGDFKDALLKLVENHPNLKAHPGPRTIILQWRV
jgi:hypothetical protein